MQESRWDASTDSIVGNTKSLNFGRHSRRERSRETIVGNIERSHFRGIGHGERTSKLIISHINPSQSNIRGQIARKRTLELRVADLHILKRNTSLEERLEISSESIDSIVRDRIQQTNRLERQKLKLSRKAQKRVALSTRGSATTENDGARPYGREGQFLDARGSLPEAFRKRKNIESCTSSRVNPGYLVNLSCETIADIGLKISTAGRRICEEEDRCKRRSL